MSVELGERPHRVSDRNWQIYLDRQAGERLVTVAVRNGVSVERARQIVYAVERRLRQAAYAAQVANPKRVREPKEPRMPQSAIGRVLVGGRRRCGLTQRDLADRAQVSRSYLCDLERGRGTKPSTAVVKRLALVLGIPPSSLVPEEDAFVVNDHGRAIVELRLHAIEAQAQALLDAVREMRQYLLVTQPAGGSDQAA